MGLFNLFKKSDLQAGGSPYYPYRERSTNHIYNLLFCDNPELYRPEPNSEQSYPYNILFAGSSSPADLQRIVDDVNVDPRIKLLVYDKLRQSGHPPAKKELLAVIVEVAMPEGLDVLASFVNGTARYINYTGKIIIWENNTDAQVQRTTRDLFAQSADIVSKIGPWDQPRKPQPKTNYTRISFLVSDGLYFGEAPTDVLFRDQLAAPALQTATRLMQYLTEKSVANQKQ